MQSEGNVAAEWLEYAKSDLSIAKVAKVKGVKLEMLCFHAQQVVEKCIKAVLSYYQIPFPKVHMIGALISLLPEDLDYPSEVYEAASLSIYASVIRYPGEYESVDETKYLEALKLAESVLKWAEGIIPR